LQVLSVNLAVGRSHGPAVGYAVSGAKTLEADLVGIAFCYEPLLVAGAMEAIPADFIETQRAENVKAAREAIARFKQATAHVDLPAEMQTIEAGLEDAPSAFGRLARTFDVAIVCQTEPDKLGPDDRIVEADLFESGRPVILVPYIHKDGLNLDRAL